MKVVSPATAQCCWIYSWHTAHDPVTQTLHPDSHKREHGSASIASGFISYTLTDIYIANLSSLESRPYARFPSSREPIVRNLITFLLLFSSTSWCESIAFLLKKENGRNCMEALGEELKSSSPRSAGCFVSLITFRNVTERFVIEERAMWRTSLSPKFMLD